LHCVYGDLFFSTYVRAVVLPRGTGCVYAASERLAGSYRIGICPFFCMYVHSIVALASTEESTFNTYTCTEKCTLLLHVIFLFWIATFFSVDVLMAIPIRRLKSRLACQY
jgi:hypothetical protein